MKLIIQKIGDDIFAYREEEQHHKTVEKGGRGTPLLDPNYLLDDCTISSLGDFHMVFNLKTWPKPFSE